jgi:hypothetical protein
MPAPSCLWRAVPDHLGLRNPVAASPWQIASVTRRVGTTTKLLAYVPLAYHMVIYIIWLGR